MAAIQNARDLLLQAAAPRFVPVSIPIGQVDGLADTLNGMDGRISLQGTAVAALQNNTRDLIIYASATTFVGASSSITLSVGRKNDLVGAVTWSVTAGTAALTPAGDSCTVGGASVSGYSVTIRARVVASGKNYDAFVTLTKLGTLAADSVVNLTTQVTGQLASGNVSGLGALALQSVIHLNTQTVGALNGQTQIAGLGGLAFKDKASASADITGLGALATQSSVNGQTQLTGMGSLAYSNSVAAGSAQVTGFGALATQSVVNAATQVTNLGLLAFASALAADQIGAGILSAGVLYAGTLDASQINAGIITGRRFRTAASGARTEIFTLTEGGVPDIVSYGLSGDVLFRVSPTSGAATVYAKAITGGVALQAENSASTAALQARNAGAGPAVLAIGTSTGPALLTQASGGVDIKLTPRSSLPAPTEGGIAYHSTHKFIFSDGTGWFKPTWTAL